MSKGHPIISNLHSVRDDLLNNKPRWCDFTIGKLHMAARQEEELGCASSDIFKDFHSKPRFNKACPDMDNTPHLTITRDVTEQDTTVKSVRHAWLTCNDW